MNRRERRGVAWIVVAVAALTLAVAFRGALERAAVAAVLDGISGYRIAFDQLSIGLDRAAARGMRVTFGGRPVLSSDAAEVRYSLRDLLPGGARAYGLVSVRLSRPRLELRRRADGTFDIAPWSGGGPAAPAGTVAGTPLHFSASVTGGSVALLDPGRLEPASRGLAARGIDGTLHVDTAGVSRYAVRGDLQGRTPQPFSLRGRWAADGYALHRLRAGSLDVVPALNYALDSAAVRVFSGTLRGIDLRAYAFPSTAGMPAYHLAGGAMLSGGAMQVPGVIPQAVAIRGRIDLFDNGVAAPRLTGALGALNVRLAGALFGWSSPALRLGVMASGTDLMRARALFAFSRKLPLRGAAAVGTLVEGRASDVLVATRLQAATATYRAFPLSAIRGRALYYRGSVAIVGARARYAGLGVSADGAIDLAKPGAARLAVRVRGPAADMPYLAQAAPDAGMRATGVLRGSPQRYDLRATVDAGGPQKRVAGLVHVAPDGSGSVGPFFVAGVGGASLAGSMYLARAGDGGGFWLEARGAEFTRLAAPPHLPGMNFGPPPFGAVLDGSLAGVGAPGRFRIAGLVDARSIRVGSVAIERARGRIGGTLGDTRLGGVEAHGAWGDFLGEAAYVGDTLALDGDYRGSFARLQTFTGDLGAGGPVAGPVALLIGPSGTIVQARGDASPGARVRGVPLDRIAGTLGVEARAVRIFSATASLAGGTFVAAGSLAARHRLGVSAAGLEATRLRAFAPLERGRFGAIGSVGYAGPALDFSGGADLAGASFDRLPLAANGAVSWRGSQVRLGDTDAMLGSSLGDVAGTVSRVGSGSPSYDVGVRLRVSRLAALAAAVAPQRDVTGTLSGDFRLRGSAGALALTGKIALPEGSVDGLTFRNAAALIAADGGGLRLRRGAAQFGSTQTTFAALLRTGQTGLRVLAPHADLADFNDLFDAGDTLGGRGSVALRFFRDGRKERTSADIDISQLRYRRYALGDAVARWDSRGGAVRGRVAFGGISGRLETGGTLVLAPLSPTASLAEQLLRSRFDGSARLRGLDLGVWLPALAYEAPLTGRIDADATIRGVLRNPDVDTTASVSGGAIGKFPVEKLLVSAKSTLSRTTLRSAELDLPGLKAVASGTFGLRPGSRLALAVHASSPSAGSLAARLFGAGYPVTGSAEADVKVGGTRAKPQLAGGFDFENGSLRGVAIRRALGEFDVHGRDVVLRDVEIGFANGALYFAGSVPVQLPAAGLGPAGARIDLDALARTVDLADFAPLLPAGSTLRGRVDGHVKIAGTVAAPQLDGALTLSDGELRSPLETEPLSNIEARLGLSGTSVRLEALHAQAGGGTLDASGLATLHPASQAAYRFEARAKGLQLNLPAYGSARVDGALTLMRRSGEIPRLAGQVAVADATIPFSALLAAGGGASPAGSSASPVATGGDVAFDIGLAAGRNVRVRSNNVDIGGQGDVHLGGTRHSPVLAGSFSSTGGTLTYFNTVFRLSDATVTFEPSLGVVPTLEADATTHLLDPDPNLVRNSSGTADITLDVSGPVTNLTIGLSSDPPYDRQQILGLLLNAPALGATNLFGEQHAAPTLYGSNATAGLPPGTVAYRESGGQFSVAQEAFGLANAQFTRALLAPIETSFASAVGLSSFNVNVDYTGTVGLTARKILGKKFNALYGTSFGYPYRQTFGFEIKPDDATAAQVTVFQTLGATGITSLAPTGYNGASNLKLQAAQPSSGSIGFSLSLQRLFP